MPNAKQKFAKSGAEVLRLSICAKFNSIDSIELFCECLLEFRSTKTFENIPKSKGFISFCIDHDENLEIALERLKRIKL